MTSHWLARCLSLRTRSTIADSGAAPVKEKEAVEAEEEEEEIQFDLFG